MVVILLVLANAGYFAWTQGWLAPLGFSIQEQAESHRLQEQIQPEVIRLLNAPRKDSPNTPPAPAPAPTPMAKQVSAPDAADVPAAASAAPASACWRAGGYTPTQAAALRQALQAQAALAGLWQMDEAQTSGRWIVYMGKLNDELMPRKKAELKEMNVEFREIRGGALGPALALGTFSTEAAAQQGLAIVTRKGVRTARVVQERPEATVFSLRLPAVTDEQRAAVEALGEVLAGKRLAPCE
jgi:hypothetical protein